MGVTDQVDERHDGRPARSRAQLGALLLAILFLAEAACGIFLMCQGIAEWMQASHAYAQAKPFGTNFEISLGTVALARVVPGVLSLALSFRVTRARLRANGVCVALVWLAFLAIGAATGAWQGGIHLRYLVAAVVPALYTACVVACARDMGRRSKTGPADHGGHQSP